ncbi:MAG: hypothetical protein ABW092_12150 [Candidatus Thiodiazotropha sp.]
MNSEDHISPKQDRQAAGYRRFLYPLILLLGLLPMQRLAADTPIPIDELLKRSYLDDYHSNVVFGYRIVTETERYGARYSGNRLRCSNCHLDAGRRPDAMPLNVAGMYPKWRSKNGRRNGIGLRIRECFVYSLDGIMPPRGLTRDIGCGSLHLLYFPWRSDWRSATRQRCANLAGHGL